jgi:hypothetical protein
MSKKPTKVKTKAPAKPNPQASTISRAIVLFGLDEHGKPRAARFIDDNEHLVGRLAQALGLRMGIATGSKHADTLDEIPVGRVYATGKGSVPTVSQELYDSLNALVGGDPGTISSALPKSWDDLAPGHLVLAQESIADGWFEALLVKREGESLRLRWRDYPSQPEFARPITAVALLKHD